MELSLFIPLNHAIYFRHVKWKIGANDISLPKLVNLIQQMFILFFVKRVKQQLGIKLLLINQ